MKRITRIIALVSLTGAATAASAVSITLPSAAQETYSQYEVFPNIKTRAGRYGDSAAALSTTFPSGAQETYSHYEVFPNIKTRAAAYRADEMMPAGATGRLDESASTWGVGRRGRPGSDSPFPSQGGPIDD